MYAWDVMAMGNFPYPSNYLVFQETGDPTVSLPAYPVRAACEHMTARGVSLLDGLMGAVSVLYNATKAKVCMEVPSDPNFDGIWDYQYCTEKMPQETYFGRDGINDMFWADPANQTAIRENCAAKWGVTPRDAWIDIAFNGVEGASNIVFSNGLYDPWSSGGVLQSSGDGKIVAVVIPEGAHHLDLFFAHPLDPESVKVARRTEMEHVSKWIKEKDSEQQRGRKRQQIAESR
jgi:lysosomal Pro-X carboxypeptidase